MVMRISLVMETTKLYDEIMFTSLGSTQASITNYTIFKILGKTPNGFLSGGGVINVASKDYPICYASYLSYGGDISITVYYLKDNIEYIRFDESSILTITGNIIKYS